MLTMLVTRTRVELSDGPDDGYTIVLEVGGVNHRLTEGELTLLLTPVQAATIIAQALGKVKDEASAKQVEHFLGALDVAMRATGAGSVVEEFADEG